MYELKFPPIELMIKELYKPLTISSLSISLMTDSTEDYESLNTGFQELLNGNVLISAQDPLRPVFQVLESLGIFEVTILDSVELCDIASTLGNMMKKYKSGYYHISLELNGEIKYQKQLEN